MPFESCAAADPGVLDARSGDFSPCNRVRRIVSRSGAGAADRVDYWRRPELYSAGKRSRPIAYGANRHHRRTGIRLRALQGARLSAAERDRAYFRRRPLAGEHAGGAAGTRGAMYESDLLRGRQAFALASRDTQTGGGAGAYDRDAHLVARHVVEKADRRSQGRNRERLQRRADGLGRRSRTVLPLSLAGAPARARHLSGRTEHRHLLDGYGFV